MRFYLVKGNNQCIVHVFALVFECEWQKLCQLNMVNENNKLNSCHFVWRLVCAMFVHALNKVHISKKGNLTNTQTHTVDCDAFAEKGKWRKASRDTKGERESMRRERSQLLNKINTQYLHICGVKKLNKQTKHVEFFFLRHAKQSVCYLLWVAFFCFSSTRWALYERIREWIGMYLKIYDVLNGSICNS